MLAGLARLEAAVTALTTAIAPVLVKANATAAAQADAAAAHADLQSADAAVNSVAAQVEGVVASIAAPPAS